MPLASCLISGSLALGSCWTRWLGGLGGYVATIVTIQDDWWPPSVYESLQLGMRSQGTRDSWTVSRLCNCYTIVTCVCEFF